ncbi:DUF4230 domain-containing protein [Anoxybacterium hadale]|uniref:DUF4230 domain-containing protein n=1 Tax=Anoxybacterium hadale TaxID=3408580 RepID=A0ACD1ACK7_9FIRM|nr:DUF4230 domain-containing protein [Clostridiales bacterium]
MVKRLKWILPTILIALIFSAGVYVSNKYDLVQTSTKITSETSLLQDHLLELSEWTTLKYEYSNVIISRTEKNLALPGISDINYGKTIKLIEYSGYLKAGTDLSKIQVSYDALSKELLIKIPKSQILDNVVETEKTKVEDVTGNLFSDYPTQIVFDEINANKKQLEEEKVNQGFLEEADQRVRQLLISFSKAKGYEDIVIEFF